MKKYIYLFGFLISSFAITACKDENSAPEYVITGDWKPLETVATLVNNGQGQSTISQLTACEQKSRLTVTAENTAHYSIYGQTPTDCAEIATKDYMYVYDKNAKTLKMNSGTESIVYTILKLTDTQLQLKYTDATIPSAPVSYTTYYQRP